MSGKFARMRHAEPPLAPPRTGLAPGLRLLVLAVFLLVLGGRLLLISQHGNPLPQLDEWGALGTHLLKPAHEGTLSVADLFATHNEHRIVTTRVLTLGLASATDSWPTWPQLAANALLNALLAGLLAWAFGGIMGSRARLALAGALVLTLGGPLGWQNALWAFQSQHYLCALFTGLALVLLIPLLPCDLGPDGLASAKTWSWARLGAGLAALLLAQLSMAPGLFATLAVCAVALLRLRHLGLAGVRAALPLAGALLAALALGLLWAPHGTHASALAPASLAQALAVFVTCLAWPLLDIPLAAALLHAPALLTLGGLLLRRRRPSHAESLALALWLLALLASVGIAATRAGGLVNGLPLSRYQDTLVPGLIANLVLCLTALPDGAAGRILRTAWFAAALMGLTLLWNEALVSKLPLVDRLGDLRIAMVEDWESGRDRDSFAKAIVPLRPAPEPSMVTEVLTDPHLRARLPRDFRESAPWPLWLGPALAGLGLALLIAGLARKDKKARPEGTG